MADSGEDAIAFSSEGGYAANVEKAEALAPAAPHAAPAQELRMVDTPTPERSRIWWNSFSNRLNRQ